MWNILEHRKLSPKEIIVAMWILRNDKFRCAGESETDAT